MSKISLVLISHEIQRYNQCVEPWKSEAKANLSDFEREMPSGSGIDCGCKINIKKSKQQKIVISTSFHHMDESGGYDGWTEHEITITPTFGFFDLKISGNDRNGIKDYLYSVFYDAFCVV